MRWWLLSMIVVAFAAPRTALADALDDVKKRGALVWGADQEGGGPYVFPMPGAPDEVTGFEVELAGLVAARLGVTARFFQGNWDKLPDLLRTKQIDVVMNGFELTPERTAVMAASKPYYVYGLQLLVRTEDVGRLDWKSLAERPGTDAKRRVGVLTGSAAESLAKERFGEAVEVIGYDGNTDSMREVETRKLDATIQDTPIVAFYSPSFPGLAPVDEPQGEGLYVLYARAGESRLVSEIDAALSALHQSGELEQLYRRYGMWNGQQAGLTQYLGAPPGPPPEGATPTAPSAEPPITAPARQRGLDVARAYGWILIEAAGMTLLLSVTSFPLAMALGLLVALGRMYGPRWVSKPLGAYVEILRGTPLMLQLFVIFFLLPEIGIRIPALTTAIVGLAVNYSAYESEIYRAGLQAVPRGQMEAALALGLGRGQALRYVVVPQATRIVIPPVVNDFIALFKDTSVCSVITIVELTKRYSVLNMSTQATIELTVMTAVLYLAMSLPLAYLSRRLEARLGAQGIRH